MSLFFNFWVLLLLRSGPGRYGAENSFIEEGEGGLNSSCSHRRRIPRYSCGQFAWQTLLWIVFVKFLGINSAWK